MRTLRVSIIVCSLLATSVAAAQTEPGFVQWRLQPADRRVPVYRDDALAFAPLDQQLETLYRRDEHKSLHPVGLDPERVLVPEIIDLGGIFALDRLNTEYFALPVGRCLLAGRQAEFSELGEGRLAEFVMVRMYAPPIAIEPATHGTQEDF